MVPRQSTAGRIQYVIVCRSARAPEYTKTPFKTQTERTSSHDSTPQGEGARSSGRSASTTAAATDTHPTRTGIARSHAVYRRPRHAGWPQPRLTASHASSRCRASEREDKRNYIPYIHASKTSSRRTRKYPEQRATRRSRAARMHHRRVGHSVAYRLDGYSAGARVVVVVVARARARSRQ